MIDGHPLESLEAINANEILSDAYSHLGREEEADSPYRKKYEGLFIRERLDSNPALALYLTASLSSWVMRMSKSGKSADETMEWVRELYISALKKTLSSTTLEKLMEYHLSPSLCIGVEKSVIREEDLVQLQSEQAKGSDGWLYISFMLLERLGDGEKYKAAFDLGSEMDRIILERFGSESLPYAVMRIRLGKAIMDSGNVARGRRYIRTSLESMKKLGKTHCSFFNDNALGLGDSFYDSEDYEDALRLYKLVQEEAQDDRNASVNTIAEACGDATCTLAQLERYSEQLELSEKTMKGIWQKVAETSDLKYNLMLNHYEALRNNDRIEEAYKWIELTYSLVQEYCPEDIEAFAEAAFYYANCLMESREYREAEKVLLNNLVSVKEYGTMQVRLWYEKLASIYHHIGNRALEQKYSRLAKSPYGN